METKDENVPSTARLNFGSKAEAAAHAHQAADAAAEAQAEDTPETSEDTGAVSPLNDPAASTQMDAVEDHVEGIADITSETPETTEAPEEHEVEEVAAVAPEEDAASEPEVVEPEAEAEDQPVDEAAPADEQVETVETEAEDEPNTVTGEGEDEGPVEVELEAPAATTTDADGKTVEELQEERERLDAQIKARTDAQKASVIEQIKTVVETYSISVEELVEALGGMKSKRKGVKAKQKYRDPVTGATWSGRGKEPAWIKGQNRDTFLIPDAP